ncbi:hypothetical protein GGS23DRAFT_620332 [Durotheca rogersii]|uniref:uncharacterized protein n=1 Tax=Durotheca rogersii TaxID=419775 RepID=UPI002220ED52|nr:uncharacterized protein GGS23DRAFT_620332 [Durotheca rogersii]KAI5853641.1 hypothetical protein GGS23DRAFT_620332 [Durotheca rogersii]
MDWPRAEGPFNDNDFRNFKYTERGFKIIWKQLSDRNQKPVICWDIKSSQHLKGWIAENRDFINGDCKDGIFAVRAADGEVYRSHPSYLPVLVEAFGQLIELFHISPMIVRAIRREIANFSRKSVRSADPPGNRIVYTARMSSTWPNDIAMSSTYIVHKKLSMSVFYGCTDKQSEGIRDMLANAGPFACHPMLAAGILAELDFRRLSEQADTNTDDFVSSKEGLGGAPRDPGTLLNRDGEEYQQLMDLYDSGRTLIRGIRVVKQQISKMIQHTHELEKVHAKIKAKKITSTKLAPRFDVHSNMELQIRERLLEMLAEYDQKMDQCDQTLDMLNFSTQVVSGHVARHQTAASERIAMETKRDNKQMKSIALMTMVFLPLTTVAAVFSMDVFDWRATGFNNVVTPYFWVYLGIAGILTVTIVGIWWALTRDPRRRRSLKLDLEKAE